MTPIKTTHNIYIPPKEGANYIRINDNDIKWISVKDKLPDNDISFPPKLDHIYDVLVSDGWDMKRTTFTRNKNTYAGSFNTNRLGLNKITHWFLLPQVPNKQKED